MKKTSFFLVATCGGFTPPLAALRNSGLCLRRRTRAGLESGLQNLNVAVLQFYKRYDSIKARVQ